MMKGTDRGYIGTVVSAMGIVTGRLYVTKLGRIYINQSGVAEETDSTFLRELVMNHGNQLAIRIKQLDRVLVLLDELDIEKEEKQE